MSGDRVAKRAPHRTASSTGYLKRVPNRSKVDFICYFEGNCGCLETGGLTTTHRLMVNRSWCRWNDRIGPQCAPKCPSFEPPFGRFTNTRLGPYFRILTFSDAVFCSNQLASSSMVPRGLLPMRFGVIVRPFHARVTFWPILDNLVSGLLVASWSLVALGSSVRTRIRETEATTNESRAVILLVSPAKAVQRRRHGARRD